MTQTQRRTVYAAIFWVVFIALVLLDWVRGAPLHDRFDAPAPWALGSGTSAAAKGAHCAALPRK